MQASSCIKNSGNCVNFEPTELMFDLFAQLTFNNVNNYDLEG